MSLFVPASCLEARTRMDEWIGGEAFPRSVRSNPQLLGMMVQLPPSVTSICFVPNVTIGKTNIDGALSSRAASSDHRLRVAVFFAGISRVAYSNEPATAIDCPSQAMEDGCSEVVRWP
jgi:hypothetical protein